MKNLKEYIIEGIFDVEDNIDNIDESIKEQIKKFLKDNFDGASSCKISDKPNNDGKYEVSSSKNINVKNYKITSLTNGLFIWATVDSDFNCETCNSLTSLEGAPKEVGKDFNCSWCGSLKSLEGAPEKVGDDFYCSNCKSLTTLKGAPEKVGGNFDCYRCVSLISLEGAPKEVGGNFNCNNCASLTSLEGAPKEVGGGFYCIDCKLKFTEEDVKNISNVNGNIIV